MRILRRNVNRLGVMVNLKDLEISIESHDSINETSRP